MNFVANIFFEHEIESKYQNVLEIFHKHPLFRQLQYLPLIFLNGEDTLLVTELPDQNYLDNLKQRGITDLPQIELLEKFRGNGNILKSWASSQLVQKWAEENGVVYEMPPFEIAREINSKLFSYELAPKLPHSRIVEREDDFILDRDVTKWVLKTAQGFSGLGNFIFQTEEKEAALKFCEKKWQTKGVLILEPWVERVLDFSTQWQIQKESKLLGVTKCLNHPNGGYIGTEVGDRDLLFAEFNSFIDKHIEYCKGICGELFEIGYFGALGFDAMVYKDDKGDLQLHSIVEINARMTMSAACLFSSQKYFSQNSVCHWQLEKKQGPGFLPEGFKRQLILY